MSGIIRFIPGVLAAIVGYVVLRLVGLFDVQSAATEFIVFLAVYIVVALLADHAMRTYGK